MPKTKKIRVVLDAMGGDKAPRAVVEGAVEAAREYDYDLFLVGDENKINRFLNNIRKSYPKERIKVVHASEAVGMDEAAAVSVRKKKNSSIAVGLNLVKTGKADVFISAGNTGAVVASASLKLRMLPFVARPGISVLFPTLEKPVLLIDIGANIHPKPAHLFEYAVMASALMKHIHGRENPKIALFNIGEEETKGTNVMKEAYALLEDSDINFTGNIEAGGIYTGEVDVVICDGLIGNTVLKVTEGFAKAFARLLKRELSRSLLPKIGAILSLPAFRALKKKTDYKEYGGAPLLGVNGAVIISHGSSNAEAIKHAVRAAGAYVKQGVNAHIVEDLQKYEDKLNELNRSDDE